jgi:predicted dehydrogenase
LPNTTSSGSGRVRVGLVGAGGFGSYTADIIAQIRELQLAGVAVVTPHNTHRDIAVAAARAGRHVFCEKAMAINAAECHEMIDAAASAGVKLMVGHKRRFRPA